MVSSHLAPLATPTARLAPARAANPHLRRGPLLLALITGIWMVPDLNAQSVGWVLPRSQAGPVGRLGHAMAFDSARGRLVMFGGFNYAAGGYLPGTWEWDSSNWRPRTSATEPAARYDTAMAYDAARQRVVLFGGYGRSGALGPFWGDTWEWDGVAWVERTPAVSPSSRAQHAMAYDAARQRVVLFGGSGFGIGNDTWEWDGANWARRTPALSPPYRYYTAMAYDAARQRVVLFGGSGTGIGNDTWEWDGTSWLQRASTGPSARQGPAMAYDASRGRTVLFGGFNRFTSLHLGDTWEWDGTAWRQVAAGIPSPRDQSAMAYDDARQRVVLFGGGFSTALNDMWDWDGARWTPTAPFRPAPRDDVAMAYDEHGRVVLYGGSDGFNALADHWEWNGVVWRRRTSAITPGARRNHAMAYDAGRLRVVLYGGGANSVDTWEWDGSSWVQYVTAVNPGVRTASAMAYDPISRRVILVGERAGHWEWDGSSWSQRSPAVAPGQRNRPAMAYDAARMRLVLFGGHTAATGMLSAETWEWNGATWAQRTPLTSPSPRMAHAMAWDAERQRVVLFGGLGNFGELGDTWDWDGSNWQQQQVSTIAPSVAAGHAMATSPAHGVELFGGSRSAQLYNDNWRFGTLLPASGQAFGTACPGTNGPPVLGGGVPFLGNEAFTLDLGAARPNAFGLFALAARSQALAIGGGCTLYLQAPMFAEPLATNGAGIATLGLPIPMQGTLLGAVFHAQAFVLDPFAVLGFACSGGQRFVIGD